MDLNELLYKYNNFNIYTSLPNKKLEPYEVFNLSGIECEIDKCEGKIIKEPIVPYPPGIPIICSGEVLSLEIINNIKSLLDNNFRVLGIRENKVKIVI